MSVIAILIIIVIMVILVIILFPFILVRVFIGISRLKDPEKRKELILKARKNIRYKKSGNCTGCNDDQQSKE